MKKGDNQVKRNMSEHKRYARLAKISQLINSNLDIHSLLESVVTAISEEVIQCDSVGIYLPQDDGKYQGYIGKPNHINGITLDQMYIDLEADQFATDIIEMKKGIYIPDTSKDSRPDPRPIEMFQIKSIYGLPIMYDDTIFGLVFLFDYGIPMNLTSEQMEAVEAYVNMAAVAIRNARQYNHIQSLLNEKQLLLDVTRELSLCSSTEDILDTCFRYVRQVLKNTNIGVHLCDSIGQTFRPAKLSQESDWNEEDWRNTHHKIDINYNQDLIFQEVIETKKYILIPDIDEDARPNKEACNQFGIKGIFMLPLIAVGEVLGTIAVVSLGKVRNYSNIEMQLTQSIADATATALSNAIQIEQLELIIDKRTEELQESKKILELILNSAGEGIFGLNLKSSISFCNPAASNMLGYSVAELIGKSYLQIFSTDDSTQGFSFHHKSMIHPFDGDVPYSQEKMLRKKNGELFPVEYVNTPIIENEKIVGAVILFKDISERRKTEELIRKTDKLSVIGELAAGVAHEIRNPLTTIKGFIQLMQYTESGKKENIDIMLSELERINFIASELLFLAKPQEVIFEKIDLKNVLESVITLLDTQAILNDIQIIIHDYSSCTDITCTETQLKQAFINILKNAIEAMEQGGKITIYVENPEENYVQVRFVDEGCGISEERMARLGEPFYTTKEKGFGLGLMVTFQIVKFHHGTIEFQKNESKGTTVIVKLPIKQTNNSK